MPRPTTSGTFRGAPRVAVIAVAVVLGALALCLVVFGTSQKQLQLGVLLGLWAALIAACLIFADRRGQPEAETAAGLDRAEAAELGEARLQIIALQQEQLETARQAHSSQEVELRQSSELQLAREAGARRESELGLESSLRREIERVMIEQLGSLREEVAALRAEVVDKLGGQVRLERIETTRVIGSDLEALQHEIRRLASGRADSFAAPARAVPASPAGWGVPTSPAERTGQERPSDIVEAELVEFPPPVTALPPASPPTAAGLPGFPSLPRLSPLQDDLGLLSDVRAHRAQAELAAEQRSGRRRAPDPEQAPEDPRYQGRRRADGDPAGWLAAGDS
ncbi:MAG: DUF6779 domain-containing protein [Jatrophihabitantaceae bacterium]